MKTPIETEEWEVIISPTVYDGDSNDEFVVVTVKTEDAARTILDQLLKNASGLVTGGRIRKKDNAW